MKKLFFVLLLTVVASSAGGTGNYDFSSPVGSHYTGIRFYNPDERLYEDTNFLNILKCRCREDDREARLIDVNLIADVDGTTAAMEFICQAPFALPIEHLLYSSIDYETESMRKFIYLSCHLHIKFVPLRYKEPGF